MAEDGLRSQEMVARENKQVRTRGKKNQKAAQRQQAALLRATHQQERLATSIARLPAQVLRLRTLGDPQPVAREAQPPIERVSLEAKTGTFEAFRIVSDGMTFFAPDLASLPGDDEFLERLLGRRSWPTETVALISSLVNGGTMLDVGAHMGLTSIPRAILGLFDHIHAFEPEPQNFACLSRAIVENGMSEKITPWHSAVGRDDGEIGFIVANMVARHRVAYGAMKATDTVISVPATTLDTWAKANSIDPRSVRYIKCDTQGYEFHIMTGAESFLAVPGVVWQLEVHPGLLKSAGVTRAQFCDLLTTNFTVYLDMRNIRAGLRPISGVEQVLKEMSTKYTDLVAITKGR